MKPLGSLHWKEKNAIIRFFYSDVLEDTIAVFPDHIKEFISEWAEWFSDIPVYINSEMALYMRKRPSRGILIALHEKRKVEMQGLAK